MAGAGNVGARGLQRVRLDDGDVLERGRMEDQLRADLGEDPLQGAGVAHVAEMGAARQVRPAAAQLGVDPVEVELAVVQQRDLGGLLVGELAHQLAADRAAGAGHQDPPALHQAAHRFRVEHDLRPAQQVLDGDRLRPDRLARSGAFEVGQARQTVEGQSVPLGEGQQLAQTLARQVLGQDQALRLAAVAAAHPGEERVQLVQAADDGHAPDPPSDPPALVVDDRKHLVAGIALEGGDEQLGRVAGADQQHRHAQMRVALEDMGEAAVLE